MQVELTAFLLGFFVNTTGPDMYHSMLRCKKTPMSKKRYFEEYCTAFAEEIILYIS